MTSPEGVRAAVESTIGELELEAEDQAASALALRLAGAIDFEDSGRTLAELARQLLAVLVELGATPAARKAVLPKGGAPVERSPAQKAKDELKDELKARRARGSDAS